MFFAKGLLFVNKVMIACLNACGHKPSESYKFRVLVMGKIRVSVHSVNKNAGHGSSEHDLHGEGLMILKT